MPGGRAGHKCQSNVTDSYNTHSEHTWNAQVSVALYGYNTNKDWSPRCYKSQPRRPSCFPSFAAPAGSNLTQQPGLSCSFTGSPVSTHGSVSESPGDRFPPSGTSRLSSAWSSFISWKSAGYTGAPGVSSDQDASVSGSKGHLTDGGLCTSEGSVCQ